MKLPLGLPEDDTWTNDDWATPWWLVKELEMEFGPFDLDPCCTPETAKAPKFYTKHDDGLNLPWSGLVFCNPPYTEKKLWLQRAYEAAQAGCTVICLIPANTKDEWFHRLVQGRAEVRFLPRLQFEGPEGRTTNPFFGNMLAIYRPPPEPKTA